MDRVIGVCGEWVLPALERQEGFVGFNLMSDREANRLLSTTLWENNEAAMIAGERGEYLQEQTSRILPDLAVPPEIWHYAVELIS